MFESRSSYNKNPEEEANKLSLATFWWLNSFMKMGSKKTLNVNDLFQLLNRDKSQNLGKLLNRKLIRKENGKINLINALIRVFGPRICLITSMIFCGNCLFGIGPFLCLPMFIRSFDDDTIPIYLGYLCAIVVVLGPGIYTIIYNLTYFALQREGMRVRIALSSIIYNKCMMLSQKAFCSTSIGQVINMITNDVQQLELCVPNTIGFPLAGIFQMTVSLTILIYMVGPSCCVGISTMIFSLVFNGYINRIFNNLRIQHALTSDERIGFMNEIFTGIRVIKMYAWEKPFGKIIDNYRRKEVNILRRSTYLKSLFFAIYEMSTGLTIFLTILTELFLENRLTAEKVYFTVALFGNIKLIMDYFPNGIAGLYQIQVSIDRIQGFLSLPGDVHISNNNNTASNHHSSSDKMNNTPLILCNKLVAKWATKEENDGRSTLEDLTFSIQNGQSIGIVGTVGSGKSSLLNVLLGELTVKSGTCQVVGRLAYASQDPWILPATVRDNILCGNDELIDQDHYSKVLRACSLGQDLSQFPKGDATEVGERGISLSGGQKARINLARALCVDADIYLLDDPFSAVDANVGRFIYKNAIKKLLKGKIVVLVTHQIHHLRDMERIVVLKRGKIEAIGNFETLSTDNRFSEIFGNESVAKYQYERFNRIDVESLNIPSSQKDVDATLLSNISSDDDGKKQIDNRLKLMWKYLREGGSLTAIVMSFLGYIVVQFGRNATHYWLTIVTESASKISNETKIISLDHDWIYKFDIKTNMDIYAILIGSSVVLAMINLICFYLICMKSSINIHNDMTQAILRAPMHFFDRNPIGRILNRFSKDIGTIDNELPRKMHLTFDIALYALGGMLLIGWINPWLLLPIPFIFRIFYKIREYYLMTARDVKRLESTTYSSMLVQLSSTLNGLTTLRAHRYQPTFQKMFEQHQDAQTSAYYMSMATARWFAIRLDFFCIIYTLFVSIICFALRGSINGSEAGLIICSVGEILGWFEYGICLANDMENDLISVERALEYSKDLPSEKEFSTSCTNRALNYRSGNILDNSLWPLEGAIRCQNVSLRYGADITSSNEAFKNVLKDISFTIEPKEKIGIVGRTGAGKSSLIVALFRLVEPTGAITVDGVDIKTISLSELRSKISIVPQDPFLFTGSFRDNLDPFNEYGDEELWRALETVKLKNVVKNSSEAGLNSLISEGGANLSVGQRQLVCLARAILRKNKILVMDEATANVDFETDALIQRTLKHHFKNCTVLTIAHRLNTLLDSNRVMVIDGGFLKEFDDPKVLLSQPESLFYNLVKQSGIRFS